MKVAIVSNGFEPNTMRLQPFRTLVEMGRQLVGLEHQVILISDGASYLPARDTLWDLPIFRVTRLFLVRGWPSPGLLQLVEQESPDLILWHLSLSSFYHKNLRLPFSQPVIGVITSPVHSPLEILRVGPAKLSSNLDLFAHHMATAAAPGFVLRRPFGNGGLSGAVTLSETTRRFLVGRGVPADRVWVAAPGVDKSWLSDSAVDGVARRDLRCRLGFGENDCVIAYFGSLAPVRGPFTLLEAVRRTVSHQPGLRLLVLARHHEYWSKQTVRLNNLVNQSGLKGHVQVVDEFLSQSDLKQHLMASDAVCLPFEILPSDVPLSILETMALGKAVVSTKVSSIPEIVGEDRGFLVRPSSASALAQQLEIVKETPATTTVRGQRAREYIQMHRTWAQMGKTLNVVLEKVTSGVG